MGKTKFAKEIGLEGLSFLSSLEGYKGKDSACL